MKKRKCNFNIKRALTLLAAALMLIMAACGGAAAQQEPEELTPAPVIETPSPEDEPETVYDGPPLLDVEPGGQVMYFEDPETLDSFQYYISFPENAAEGLALIVYLHGDGLVGNVYGLADSGIFQEAQEIYANEFPFIILAPNTRTYSWISGTIPGTLKALIDDVTERYMIDTEHIIITGHSRGAIGVWYMVSQYGDFFSAAVPVSCGSEGPISDASFVNVPVWGFVGDGQDFETYGHEMQCFMDIVNMVGGSAKLTSLEGASHVQASFDAYSEETFEWMLSQ